MGSLVKFLRLPLLGWAKHVLGIDEEEEVDLAALEDEPFSTEAREQTSFLRSVWLAGVGVDRPIEETYDLAVQDRALRGAGPLGPFAESERAVQLETLISWTEQLQSVHGLVGAITVHRFGPGTDIAVCSAAHPPLRLEVASSVPESRLAEGIEITGRTLPMRDRTSVTLARNSSPDAFLRDTSALRAFVDHAVLAASGVEQPGEFASVVVEGPGRASPPEGVTFSPLSPTEAASWLSTVVAEMLSGPHDTFLPCEAVFEHRAEGPERALVPYVLAARDTLAREGPRALRSAYGPIRHLESYPIPDEESARAQADRLFGLFFAKRKPSR
jgi:hypothetical protein